MIDATALQVIRSQTFFESWKDEVPDAFVDASEAAMRALVDRLLGFGREASEAEIQLAVRDCVEQFNQLDDGWIMTIEREGICESLERIVEACGLNASEDWVAANRNW